jgi:hypothetical protein
MTKFMINGLHPHPFAFVDAAALPVFGVYQMDTAVLEGSPGSSASIYIFKPLNPGTFNSIKAAKV